MLVLCQKLYPQIIYLQFFIAIFSTDESQKGIILGASPLGSVKGPFLESSQVQGDITNTIKNHKKCIC